MLANPYRKYQQTQVGTASPEKLLLMLYNGALKFIKGAREAILAKEIEKANHQIVRVQDIIYELMASLDFDKGEVADGLYKLYDYMNSRLIEANIKKDDKILIEVEGMVKELRNAWQEAMLSSKL